MSEKERMQQDSANTSISEALFSDKEKLRALLSNLDVSLFEYLPREDVFLVYDYDLSVRRRYENYLAQMEQGSSILPEDQHRMRRLLKEQDSTPTEVRVNKVNGQARLYRITLLSVTQDPQRGPALAGTLKDVTQEHEREAVLREKAHRDALTMLYNGAHGQNLVNEYLSAKDPFVSCALLVIDIDFFKQVNDTYGHLFGDAVLTKFSQLLTGTFRLEDIIIRAGGDEFAIFLKNISHAALINRVSVLLDKVRQLSFPENGCEITCSIGICFLPKNTLGFTYQQLFANADWALYRAKKFGRNRYEFCDSLNRFEMDNQQPERTDPDIDERFLRNDIVSSAFEIFEKSASFDAAIRQLMKVAGLRLQLDRITVIRTNTHSRTVERAYQWTAQGIPEVLEAETSFTQEDFLTLYHSYDSYGIAVLNYDEMDAYSEGARALLMQGGAKTVAYAALYSEGHYAGAVSFVSCENKRQWSAAQRSQLGELAKVIAAHISKSQEVNFTQRNPDYDSLTGLISFSRFREEIERILVGRTTEQYVLVYTDFESFKHINQKYGYQQGDQLLKDFAGFIIGSLTSDSDVYFTRVVGDQFVLFSPCPSVYSGDGSAAADAIDEINRQFIRRYASRVPGVTLHLRSGLYRVEPACTSASAAIDAANYARQQVRPGAAHSCCLYTEKLARQYNFENDILSNFEVALQNHEFQVYYQPKYSLKDRTIVGAEALVRWRRPDGTLLMPKDFVPLYERTGRTLEMDFYVFEAVAAFLAKNQRLGRKQLPISINASILHASNPDTVQKYLSILEKHGVSPSMTEIELAETATSAEFDGVVQLFHQFRDVSILTSLDDFGAGYSLLNAIIDLPINTVKISRLLLKRCEESKKGTYFLGQIVNLIKGLGCTVLCEGIETEHQLQLLRSVGCELGQGFLFSRPLPLEGYEKLLYPEG